MPKPRASILHALVRATAPELPAVSDRELLRRYADDGDQNAFVILVRRYSRLVLSVCRQSHLIGADAEDVCQAAFLVLARKAKTAHWQHSVANWLYTTARNLARKARTTAQRRATHEQRAAVPEAVPPIDSMIARELLDAVGEEIEKLPIIYREPLVLSFLEDMSREEIAIRLGVPAGTVKMRLERGKRRLGDALAKRGIQCGFALLAFVSICRARASTSKLVDSILAAAGGSPSAAVALLAQGVIMNGVLKKVLLGIVVAVTIVGAGVAWNQVGPVAAQPKQDDRRPAVARTAQPLATPADMIVREKASILVLDSDGKPVAGATIRRVTRGRSESVVEEFLGKTDADGRFVSEVSSPCQFTAVAEGLGVAWSGVEARGRDLTLKMAKPLPIKGRLTDLQGKPISGAKVTVESVTAAADNMTAAYNAYRVNPRDVGWGKLPPRLEGRASGAPPGATTDKDGRFELMTVGTNQIVQLRFQADGIESSAVTVFADPEFANRMKPPTDAEKRAKHNQHRPAVYGPQFTHAARPEHLLTGTIIDEATGKPIPGVTVWGTTVPAILGPTTTRDLNSWRDKAIAVTDKNGQFTLRGLPKAVVWDLAFLPKVPQRYLHVRAEGTPYLDKVVVVPDTVDDAPAKVEVKLRPAVVVTGIVTNKATGKPVRAGVEWLPLSSNKPLASGKDEHTKLYVGQLGAVKPSGTRIETDKDGRFQLSVPPGPAVLLASAADSDALFTSVTVREQDRKQLNKKVPGAIGGVGSGAPNTDIEESFDTIYDTRPLRVKNGYAMIDADEKAKPVDVKIEFDPGLTTKLIVTDPDGKPLTSFTLVGHGWYGKRVPTFTTAEITIGGLHPKGQPQQLYLLHKERKLWAAIQVKGDENGPVAVKMQPCATVTGRVVDPDGKPVRGVIVEFSPTEHRENSLLRLKLFGSSHTVTTDAEGRFTFERMFSDVEFSLGAMRPGFSDEAGLKSLTLKSGEVKDVEIQLPKPKKSDD